MCKVVNELHFLFLSLSLAVVKVTSFKRYRSYTFREKFLLQTFGVTKPVMSGRVLDSSFAATSAEQSRFI